MPLMSTVIDSSGGKVIGGGGPGGRVPSGRLNSHPPTSMSIQSMQILKNQRLHGMTVPSSVAFGASTEVVTGKIKPIGTSDVVVVGCTLMESVGNAVGTNVTEDPPGRVMTLPVVMPVGMVTASELSEMIVRPSEFVVVSIGSGRTLLVPGGVTLMVPEGTTLVVPGGALLLLATGGGAIVEAVLLVVPRGALLVAPEAGATLEAVLLVVPVGEELGLNVMIDPPGSVTTLAVETSVGIVMAPDARYTQKRQLSSVTQGSSRKICEHLDVLP